MAVKRVARKTVSEIVESMPEVQKTISPLRRINKWYILAVAVVAGLGIYWYKTNTWPIAAMVDGRPITRFALNQSLYKQGGSTVLDGLITEQLIRNELQRLNIKASEDEINKKYAEITVGIPAEVKVEDLLAQRGLTVKEFKDQIALQIGIEKAVGDKVSVSADEIEAYLQENEQYVSGTTSAEKRDNVESLLISQKSQDGINTWLSELRNKAKVWTPDGMWSSQATAY